MTTETDIAYLAGLLDGESYIGVKKATIRKDGTTPGYHARIQCRMVSEDAIEFLAETLGGKYYREKPHCSKGRPLYCWQVSDRLAEQIIRRVLPYLRIKRASAEAVLELRELQAVGRKHRTKVMGYRTMPGFYGPPRKMPNLCFSDEYVSLCESFYLRCKELNRVGV